MPVFCSPKALNPAHNVWEHPTDPLLNVKRCKSRIQARLKGNAIFDFPFGKCRRIIYVSICYCAVNNGVRCGNLAYAFIPITTNQEAKSAYGKEEICMRLLISSSKPVM